MALNTNTTGTGGLPNAVATYYDRNLLHFLKLKLFFDQPATKRKLPKNSGQTVKFTRYNTLSAITSSLTEGTVPNGQTLQSTQISATPAQYGGYIALSDFLILESIDPIIKGATEVLGYQAGLSIDTIIRNALDGNMTNQYVGQTSEGSVTSSNVVTADEFRKAAKALKVLGVLGVNGASEYMGMIHPASEADLMKDSAAGGWLDVNKYTSSTPMVKGEIGKLYGIRFVSAPNIKTGTGAASATTYHNWVFGDEGFGMTELDGQALKTFVKQLGSSGVSDPLDQIATVGWKLAFVTAVLDANRAVMVVGASAY